MSDPLRNPASRGKWQFSLGRLFAGMFLVAALCAPGAYFGAWGILGSFAVAIVVGSIGLLACYTRHGVEIVIVVVFLGLLAALLFPAVNVNRTPSWRSSCKNNLRQLAIAMQNYHQKHGHFPPAYIADENGTPLHSWRVLLLPFLEEQLEYKKYRWNEPWNSPHNSQLGVSPYLFQCPSDRSAKGTAMTSYVLVTGPGTPFPGEQSTKVDDIRDGTVNTILIVEVANSGIHWMEPRDLNVQQMAATINTKAGQGICSGHAGGAVVAFADGHVEFLDETTSAQQLRAMLTIDGGEVVSPRP